VAFEGHVDVEVREDGAAGAIGKGFVTGGGDVMRPFEGSISFETPSAPYGALVFFTTSAEDGRVWEAAAFRVRFASMKVKVFFDNDAEGAGVALVPVYRVVPRTAAVLRASLDALVAGPTAAEGAAGISSWFSVQTAGMVRSVALRDGHAVIDFDDLRTVISGASSSAGSARLLAELDATVFQFRAVESIEYRLLGDCEAFTEWLQSGGCEKRTRAVPAD
jgi:spore germination protein GerM